VVVPSIAVLFVLLLRPVLMTLVRHVPRVVLVTSERILVCSADGPSGLGPLLREVDRDVVLSPPAGKWGRFDQLGDHLWISKRHRQDLADADVALAASRGARSAAS
jgi:hypothetical protein